MAINSLMASEGESVFYEDGFRRMLETHQVWLAQQEDTTSRPIEPHDAMKYKGDFFGLLVRLGIPAQYHYIVMVMNGITGPQDNDERLRTLIVPSRAMIDRLRTRYKTITKKTT